MAGEEAVRSRKYWKTSSWNLPNGWHSAVVALANSAQVDVQIAEAVAVDLLLSAARADAERVTAYMRQQQECWRAPYRQDEWDAYVARLGSAGELIALIARHTS